MHVSHSRVQLTYSPQVGFNPRPRQACRGPERCEMDEWMDVCPTNRRRGPGDWPSVNSECQRALHSHKSHPLYPSR